MAKFAGMVGYANEEETTPGVWTKKVLPRYMRGDLINQTAYSRNDNKINSDVTLGHRVSLVGDAYAFDNYFNIRWVEVDGYKWEVSSIEVKRPRLIVNLGGPYNEQ